MKEKITLHAVHCLISLLQITNLYDKYLSNDWIFRCSGIGVIFLKFLLWEKAPCVKPKRGAVVQTPFWDRTNISWAITTYILFRKQLIFRRKSMEM